MKYLAGVRYIRGKNRAPVAMYYMSKQLIKKLYSIIYNSPPPGGFSNPSIKRFREEIVKLVDKLTQDGYQWYLISESEELLARIDKDIQKYSLGDMTPVNIIVSYKSPFVDAVSIHEMLHSYVRNNEKGYHRSSDKRLFVAVSILMDGSYEAEKLLRLSWKNKWHASDGTAFEEVVARLAEAAEFQNRLQNGKITKEYYEYAVDRLDPTFFIVAKEINRKFKTIWKFIDWSFTIPQIFIEKNAPIGVLETED